MKMNGTGWMTQLGFLKVLFGLGDQISGEFHPVYLLESDFSCHNKHTSLP